MVNNFTETAYITENSINSNMVRQEIDARVLERFQNDHVNLLIYLSNEDLRSRLRLDLQRLQSPILNAENYSTALPKMVSEIWRSYAESSVSSSIKSERIKRLEAELRVKELESKEGDSIFSGREHALFSTIWHHLNRETPFEIKITKKSGMAPDAMNALKEKELNEKIQSERCFICIY